MHEPYLIDVDVCVHVTLTILHFLTLFQDNYRIVIFEGTDRLNGATLKSHATFVDGHGHDRPSDRYLSKHFKQCLSVSACRGHPTKDYEDEEIKNFMKELRVHDDDIDTTDPRWTTPLGIEVNAYLVMRKMAE